MEAVRRYTRKQSNETNGKKAQCLGVQQGAKLEPMLFHRFWALRGQHSNLLLPWTVYN